jgi:hypothetical protein
MRFQSKIFFIMLAKFVLSNRSRQSFELHSAYLFLFISAFFDRFILDTSYSKICVIHDISCGGNRVQLMARCSIINFTHSRARVKNVIRQLLYLYGARYDACQPHLLSGIPLRSLCIGKCQTHIQTSACKY